ncbi:MAG: MoaD/ThiS family protein [Chloroflexi bacterium]|nr:MoaD/ThiS family protein [Chloroflexota bacterium]
MAPQSDVDTDSIVRLGFEPGQTIEQVLARLGIAPQETSNIFLNGELLALTREVKDGDRLGVFPRDMGLLYSWYFTRKP